MSPNLIYVALLQGLFISSLTPMLLYKLRIAALVVGVLGYFAGREGKVGTVRAGEEEPKRDLLCVGPFQAARGSKYHPGIAQEEVAK